MFLNEWSKSLCCKKKHFCSVNVVALTGRCSHACIKQLCALVGHCCKPLTLPVMLVIAGAGQRDHHGTVEGQDHGTETPAAPASSICEALQLARQVK